MSPDRNVPVVSTTASAWKIEADLGHDPDDTRSPVEQQVVHRLLEQRQVRLVLEPAVESRCL